MFRKILLPVDLTDKHATALATAADLASGRGGEVVLLHVIEVIPGLSMEEERDFYARLEKRARAHLERLGARLQDRSIPWRAEVLYGNRVSETLRFANASGVDVIVLTAPRFDPSNLGAGWGSLSYKISVVCSCPVLLVK
jgi:nucleotide-binding universal stress UspA family protein